MFYIYVSLHVYCYIFLHLFSTFIFYLFLYYYIHYYAMVIHFILPTLHPTFTLSSYLSFVSTFISSISFFMVLITKRISFRMPIFDPFELVGRLFLYFYTNSSIKNNHLLRSKDELSVIPDIIIIKNSFVDNGAKQRGGF